MSSTDIAPDLVLRDARLAGGAFLLCALAMLLGASIGLNTWPGQSMWLAMQGADMADLLHGLQTLSIVFVVLFWGSAPPRQLKSAVLLAWAAVSALAWLGLAEARQLLWPHPSAGSVFLYFVTTLAMPSAAATLWRVSNWSDDAGPDTARLRWLVVLTLLFIVASQPLLSLAATFHPTTLDAYALHWDQAAGLAFTPALIRAVEAVPGLPVLVSLAYGMTPVAFLVVSLRQLRGKPPHVASALLMWVGMTGCAVLAYQFFPITGPKYVYGDAFIAALENGAAQAIAPLAVKPFPRNGMPSMHFGWLLAACIVWWQSGTRPWSRALMIATAVLTAIATLYLGEHYAVDLVVAVPFVLATIALSSTGVPWRSAARRRVVWTGFACWLVWVALLRWQIERLVEWPMLCWLMLLATAVVVALQVRWMRRFAADTAGAMLSPAGPLYEPAQLRTMRGIGAMFFASGAAALIYQVLFSKQLALVFGSTATAMVTVLATFLGGMALGSLLGGLWAPRVRRPLIVYAVIEAAIGVYCVATPQLFGALQWLYAAWATGTPADAPSLLALRVALGASVLLPPTVLMGVTLPLLAHALGAQSGRMGSRVGWLYFANTAGAAVGALLAAYLIIPALGAQRTTLFAALLNLLAALGAVDLTRRRLHADAPGNAGGAADAAQEMTFAPAQRRWAFIALAAVGLLSLGLEVVYVHLLAIVAGNSVYAFGLMLATFLIGLAIGGESARRLLLRPGADTVQALVLSLLGLSLAVTLGALAWNGIPAYFAGFDGYPLARGFAAREAIRGLVCAAVMVPPTVFIGASYVLAMDIATSSATRPKVQSLGIGAALNTAGNIAGVLLFGFVLLPLLGGLGASRLIAAAALVLGAALLAVAGRSALPRGVPAAAVASFALLAASTTRLDYAALSSGANVYFSDQRWGEIIDHAESIDGGLTTVARRDHPPPAVRTLLTNGKFQGNDALDGEMQAQVGFALAPLLHQDRRDSALVIGYGSGATSRVLRDAEFTRLDIAELSHDIVRLADRHFPSVNAGVSSADNVRLHVTDGRNLLLLGRELRYDLISIEISSIWFSGAAALYNQEFYRLARSRMARDGVLQQWVQLHRLPTTDILSIVATLRSEFEFISLYVIGGQGILVATNDAQRAQPTAAALARLQQTTGLTDLRRLLQRDLADLARDRLLEPQGIDRFVQRGGSDRSVWHSTDDNLLLEYSTPRANVNHPGASFKRNIEFLASFR
jgi:spermidine synthase